MAEVENQQNEWKPSLQERQELRKWIAGRALTLLSHYWRDDDPVELTAAIGKDWADVLEGLPKVYVERACQKYLRSEPRRKPTPGAIYQMAKEAMPNLRLTEMRKTTPEEDAAYQASTARDNINPERKAQAEAIIAEAFPSKRGQA